MNIERFPHHVHLFQTVSLSVGFRGPLLLKLVPRMICVLGTVVILKPHLRHFGFNISLDKTNKPITN